jgi:DNA-binding PadR family transcriptional regulator
MKLQQIYQFFNEAQFIFLTPELAVCYVLSVLIQEDSYGSELIQRLEQQSNVYRLSDTVLYRAVRFLEEEAMIVSYTQRVVGRGRPRRMLQLNPKASHRAQELVQLWQRYMGEREPQSQP